MNSQFPTLERQRLTKAQADRKLAFKMTKYTVGQLERLGTLTGDRNADQLVSNTKTALTKMKLEAIANRFNKDTLMMKEMRQMIQGAKKEVTKGASYSYNNFALPHQRTPYRTEPLFDPTKHSNKLYYETAKNPPKFTPSRR